MSDSDLMRVIESGILVQVDSANDNALNIWLP